MKDVKNLTLKIETHDGKIKIVKNPPTIILCFLSDTLKKLHKKGVKGAVDFGGLRFKGSRISLMFCFHMITERLIDKVGEHDVLKTLSIIFNKKADDAQKQSAFEAKIKEMNKNKDKLSN